MLLLEIKFVILYLNLSVRLHLITSSVCSAAKRASARCLRATTGPSQGSTATQLRGPWTSPTCLLPPLSTGLSSCGAPRYERDVGCILKAQENLRIILFWLKRPTCVQEDAFSLCVFCGSTGFHNPAFVHFQLRYSFFLCWFSSHILVLKGYWLNLKRQSLCLAKRTHLFPLI